MEDVILALRGVSFARGQKVVLSDISLEVGSGEIVCILGPSGSGKTTLLRLVAGLLEPTSGLIEIRGRPQSSLAPEERLIGFVFQDPEALFPHLTTFENVAFPLRVRENPLQESALRERVNKALYAVHLTDKASQKPENLSGGEKQRVALARAFVYEPDLMLLDEPLHSLDNINKAELLHYIDVLSHEKQMTCLYVTHDEREATRLGDRIGVLSSGRLIQIGPPEEVFSSPSVAEVAKITSVWNLVSMSYSSKDKLVTLPPGASPSTIADIEVQTDGNDIMMAFPKHSTLATPKSSFPSDVVVLPARVESAGLTRDGANQLQCSIGGQPIVAKWTAIGPLPKPSSEVHVKVPSEEIRFYSS
jgi:putative spermidine/putrescine transport system ATP-binding protein